MKHIKFLFSMAMLAGTMPAVAESETESAGVETTLALDMVSRYVWRGADCGDASLQPTLGVTYGGLSLTAWGSVGLTDPNDAKELDLTLSYGWKGLSVGITDYWFSVGGDPKGRYFKYGSTGTNHVFEVNAAYDFGCFSAAWFTNVAGNDGLNPRGKRAYSSYFELNAPFILGGCDWTATAGAVPFATDYYATTGFAVTNLALKVSKSFKLTDDLQVPLFVQFAVNPCQQSSYLVAGLTFQP